MKRVSPNRIIDAVRENFKGVMSKPGYSSHRHSVSKETEDQRDSQKASSGCESSEMQTDQTAENAEEVLSAAIYDVLMDQVRAGESI